MTETRLQRGGSSGTPVAERAALLALIALFVITVGWWALALWPTTGVPPSWLARTRAVCFNAGPSGLPDASGWMLLIGQPIGMFAVLMVFAGDAVRGALARLRRGWAGRLALLMVGASVVTGLAGAARRIVTAGDVEAFVLTSELPAETYPRLDYPAPAFELVDQNGRATTPDRFRGRPVLVTFAFGHCEAICPMVVHETRRAQGRLKEGGTEVALVVVTLDPWRDTPSRLPHLVAQWELGDDSFVLSGAVDEVNGMLDAWGVARERDLATGDIAHPALVFIVDAGGNVAYSANGGARMIEELVGRL